MYTIDYILQNSHLPGPRGNLELLYSFSKNPDNVIVQQCLSFINDDTANSPDEFAGMCGIVGYAVLHQDNIPETIRFLRKYASHNSWRIREAVAIGIQEIAGYNMDLIINELGLWTNGNALEKRAVMAALCEPKLLNDKNTNFIILGYLEKITKGFYGLGFIWF